MDYLVRLANGLGAIPIGYYFKTKTSMSTDYLVFAGVMLLINVNVTNQLSHF